MDWMEGGGASGEVPLTPDGAANQGQRLGQLRAELEQARRKNAVLSGRFARRRV